VVALDVTKGGLYHYVQNKEDLLYAIIREAHDLTRDNVRRAQAAEGLASLPAPSGLCFRSYVDLPQRSPSAQTGDSMQSAM
jgi:AcrR family transcriptional regulator